MVTIVTFVYDVTGLQKLGIAAALINFNLRQKQLSHSVNVSGAKAFIVGQGDFIIFQPFYDYATVYASVY